ncbi:MAG: T9SS type A sorting domain-containing protein, partial [Cytophagales bacterium]|nr:T9SS type A sorting domain-containing protein [Cytophagales bacterium]
KFFETWNSNLNTTATITIRNQTSNALFGNDFALDDISFINSCQNTTSPPYAPNLGPDKSLCYNQGSITLNSNTATNPPSRGFTWYTGTGTAQTVFVPLSNSQNTLTVTTPGTYRVCVFESGQCAVSSTITINKNMSVDLGPDKSLCNPASALLNTGYSTPDPTISYLWRRGTTTISSGLNVPSYLANSAGVYTVSITSSVNGCGPVTDNVTLTSNLPIPGTGYTYCDPTNKNVTLTVSGAGTYNWYTTSAGGTSLGSGNSFATVITGTGTKIFYVDDVTATALANTSWSSGGSQFGTGHNRMKFNLTTGTQIVSVKAVSQAYQGSCGAGGTAASVIIRLLQNGATVPGYQTTYNFTCGGTHTIPVGFNIPAGSNYELEYTDDGYFQWYPCYSGCPAAINFRPNTSVTIIADQTGQSGGAFYDWIVNQVPGCARVPVTVTQSCPAPISLIDFGGTRTPKGNKITWTTISEEDNDRFELEKSYDGQSFTTIATIKGAMNSSEKRNYEWLDADYGSSNIYYRLKHVDVSGVYSYSQTILLKSTLSLSHFNVYPVPSSGELVVQLQSEDKISPNLQIINQMGVVVFEMAIPAFIGSNEIPLSIAGLPVGVYSLRVKDDTGVQIRKIVKE